MLSTVCFREFEERDVDFIYKCKNDEKLNSMIVGHFRPYTYEEARKWVEGCMGDHDTYHFWAICTNDEEKRIVGWISLSEIDKINQSACFHGIVIADKDYRNGFAWIESYCFILEYAFEHLGLNRLYGSSIIGNKNSNIAGELFLFTKEGVLREAVIKNDIRYDVRLSSILRKEYFINKKSGKYELRAILKRLKEMKKITK